jgi:hypothetical protein
MGNVNANPADQNLLQGSKFQVAFARLPYIQFFVQAINLPGISSTPAVQTTPFVDAPIPADKLKYENFSMTFLIDEPLWTWTSVNDWIKGLTFPDSFQEYKNLSIQQRLLTANKKPQYSDAQVTILTNKNNPILAVTFQDMFPVSVSGIQFSTQDNATAVKTATAEFAFTNYQISRQI